MTLSFPGGQKVKPEDTLATFEEFYLYYLPYIERYMLRHNLRKADAEDVSSLVFSYCYQHWNDYDDTKASRKTWLFVIARSKLIDFCRKQRPNFPIDTFEATLSNPNNIIETVVKLTALRKELADALLTLPSRQRQAVTLRFFGNCNDDTIAQVLHTTQGNVRVLISRALRKMQPMLSFSLLQEEAT